ncbi:MAG: glycosyltransferase family 2 protein [Spirochaetes bacterium]|nr:glycosyltransferase family 2 protein [Spirochaetota bacterium]
MATKEPQISIVVPLYNEEESLKELHSRIRSNVKKYSYEIIFIDDGSTDHSFSTLLKIKKTDKNVRIIKFKKNYGKSYAMDAGFKKAGGDYVITMDADLQDDPNEIPKLINTIKTEQLDIISGWKYKRHDPFSKTIPSKLFNFIVRIFTGIKLHDMNCGLKIYTKDAIKDLNLYGSLHRFIPVLLNTQGFRSGEIIVKHHSRKFGTSKYGGRRLIVGLLDFFTILFLSKFMKNPLHFFGIIGLILSAAGSLLVGYIVYLKIAFGTIQARLPLLNFGLLALLMGVQFFSIGLLGELLISKSLTKSGYTIEKII